MPTDLNDSPPPGCNWRRPDQENIMKGDKKVIQLLNKCLVNELTAINQLPSSIARMYK